MWDSIYPYVEALVPSAGIFVLFYFVMKRILEADRRERLAQSQWDRDHRPSDDISAEPVNDGDRRRTTP